MLKLDGKPLPYDRAFTHNGSQYPASWLRHATLSQKNAIGITEVADPPWYDQAFYWSSVKPKDLAKLKTVWVEQQKETANQLLSKSDWMVTRKAEAGTAIPSATATYRTAVRTQCGLREATINACSDVKKLQDTIRGNLAPTVAGTASNGATEKKKEDGSSYDPKQYNDIANPDLLEDWPTEPS